MPIRKFKSKEEANKAGYGVPKNYSINKSSKKGDPDVEDGLAKNKAMKNKMK